MSIAGGGWAVTSASRIGSVHVRDHRPNQDAARTWSAGEGAVIAVADGHGYHLHFRSDVGAELAAECALDGLRTALPSFTDAHTARAALPGVVAGIVDSWYAAVAAHVANSPYAANDAVDTGTAYGSRQPYGSTLLALAVTDSVLVSFQIGDGDTVAVRSNGEAFRPLAEDDAHDGVHTASLCQPEPLAAMRYVVIDLTNDDVELAFLCTDGFGSSRVDTSGWWRETGTQLVGFVRDHGLVWVTDQLPSWLEEPALVGGDDTTLALLTRTSPTTVRSPTTVPAR